MLTQSKTSKQQPLAPRPRAAHSSRSASPKKTAERERSRSPSRERDSASDRDASGEGEDEDWDDEKDAVRQESFSADIESKMLWIQLPKGRKDPKGRRGEKSENPICSTSWCKDEKDLPRVDFPFYRPLDTEEAEMQTRIRESHWTGSGILPPFDNCSIRAQALDALLAIDHPLFDNSDLRKLVIEYYPESAYIAISLEWNKYDQEGFVIDDPVTKQVRFVLDRIALDKIPLRPLDALRAIEHELFDNYPLLDLIVEYLPPPPPPPRSLHPKEDRMEDVEKTKVDGFYWAMSGSELRADRRAMPRSMHNAELLQECDLPETAPLVLALCAAAGAMEIEFPIDCMTEARSAIETDCVDWFTRQQDVKMYRKMLSFITDAWVCHTNSQFTKLDAAPDTIGMRVFDPQNKSYNECTGLTEASPDAPIQHMVIRAHMTDMREVVLVAQVRISLSGGMIESIDQIYAFFFDRERLRKERIRAKGARKAQRSDRPPDDMTDSDNTEDLCMSP